MKSPLVILIDLYGCMEEYGDREETLALVVYSEEERIQVFADVNEWLEMKVIDRRSFMDHMHNKGYLFAPFEWMALE